MNVEQAQENIIKLQALQIKNYLRELETINKSGVVQNIDELLIYKDMYEIIVSSPSYKICRKLSSLLGNSFLKRYLSKVYYFVLCIKKA